MKSLHKGFSLVSLVFALTLCTSVWGAAQGRGLLGEWHMTLDFDSWQTPSVLSISKGTEDALAAQWVSIMGISQVKDITRAGKDVTFSVVTRLGDQDYTSRFLGTLTKGQLSGLLTSDQGEITAQGKKVKRMLPIVGTWDMTITVGEREVNTVLKVTRDDQDKLQAQWESQWGKHQITDVQFNEGKLTFNRASTFNDREWKATYEGQLKGGALTGTFNSEQGKMTANGKRVNGTFVGKWDLTITSDQGTRTQRLTVLPDLTARFGAMPIKTLKIEGQAISFDVTLPFGDNEYEISFSGKVKTRKLTGQLTSSEGTSEVAGAKVRPLRQKKK